MWKKAKIFLIGCFLLQLTACYFRPQGFESVTPTRPEELDTYYSKAGSYSNFSRVYSEEREGYSIKRLIVESGAGKITIDYFDAVGSEEKLILVFPILGGRNLFESYFAEYFAQAGFDSAIVHRDKDFKKPENFQNLEEVFRKNVVRDRIALDFFEEQFGKKEFGTFGISRGAINASISAGVDSRLKYNVLALGGADLVKLFKDSKESGVDRYRKQVLSFYNITEEQFYSHLEDSIKTDPKYLAQFINADNTLIILSVMDNSVPIKYGRKLRKSIGDPKTVYLLSGHYTALAYTGFLRLVPGIPLFPPDYVETEALSFYRSSFGNREVEIKKTIFRVFQFPVDIIAAIANLFKEKRPSL
jgi:hypothetical protein